MVIYMELQPVRGMRDLLPEKAKKKKYIESVCKRIFELYGFEPLETPIVENLNILTKKGSAGSAIEEEIYAFEDKSKRKLGLRFDLTVPLARVIANNKQLAMPFKRYQIGRVYRYDRPQAKRYREFTQADADIIGSSSLLAEAELIAMSADIIEALGIEAYIALNSRKLLEELALASGVKENQLKECFRLIDKAEKLGWQNISEEFEKKGINTEVIDVVRKNDLQLCEEIIANKGGSNTGIAELKELMRYVEELNLTDFVRIELALARGLDYYTGVVMEIKTANGPSIGGGGRYDKLIGIYGSRSLPATGISFGIDRILDTIEGKLPYEPSTKVFVVAVKKELSSYALKIAQKLRKLGVSAEIDLMERSLSKNLEYASKKSIPFVAIFGPAELQENCLKLRDMRTGEEQKVLLKELKKVKEIIK